MEEDDLWKDDVENMSNEELLLEQDLLWESLSDGYKKIVAQLLAVERELTLRETGGHLDVVS